MPNIMEKARELYKKERGYYPKWGQDPKPYDPSAAFTDSVAAARLRGDMPRLEELTRKPEKPKPYDPSAALTDTLAAATLRGDVKKVRGLQELMRTPKMPERPLTAIQRLARDRAEEEERFRSGEERPSDILSVKRGVEYRELKKPLEKPKEYTRTNYNRDMSRLTTLSTRKRNVASLRGGEIEDEDMQRIMSMLQMESISPEILDAEEAAIDREVAALEAPIKQYEIKEKFKKIPKQYSVEGKVIEDTTTEPPTPYVYKNGKWIALERTQ